MTTTHPSALRTARRALLVADIVESVRIMQQHEHDLIARWMRLVDDVRDSLLPAHGGRLVKSYGDGLLLEFASVGAAVSAAIDLQSRVPTYNGGREPSAAIALRIGVHTADVVIDALDLYGAGVNLTARLASLAGPGEIVVSAQVRDCLTDGRDCFIEDIGERFIKHIEEPVRAYKVSDAAARRSRPDIGVVGVDHRPSLAVVPFACVGGGVEAAAIGDAIADDVIAALSCTDMLRVISRLSTAPFRDSAPDLQQMRRLLGAEYVVSGSFRIGGARLFARFQLADARSGHVLWADAGHAVVADVFNGQDAVVATIAAHVSRQVLATELGRARALPFGTLEGYTLYVAGMAMVHRLVRADFERARDLLEHLGERHPRSAAPHALLAKWHILRLVQGWSDDTAMTGRQARSCALQALERDPGCALAMAMESAAMGHLGADLQSAVDRGVAATHANPQEPHAWLALGSMHSYLGQAAQAEALPMRALELSPLDPGRYLFDVFVAAGKLAASKFGEAADAARCSIRANAMHPPSYRLLTIALALDGKLDEARQAGAELLRLAPRFTVSLYAQRYPGRHQPHAERHMSALRDAGIPA